jgi:hypothetical protein
MGWTGCFPTKQFIKAASKQGKQMNAKAETAVSVPSSVGIDMGKDVFHRVGFDAKGKIILRKKIKRLALADRGRRRENTLLELLYG